MKLLYGCTILKIFYYLTASSVSVVSAFLSGGGRRGGGRRGGGGGGGGFIGGDNRFHYLSSFGGGSSSDSPPSSLSPPSAVISLSQEGDDDKDDNNECGLLRIQRLVDDHDMVRGGGGGGRDSISSDGGGERYYYSTPTTTIEEMEQQQTTKSDYSPDPPVRNLPPGLIPFLKILSGVTFWNDSLQQFRRKLTVRYLKHRIGLDDGDDMYVAVPAEIQEMKPTDDDDDEIYQTFGYSHVWNIPEKHPTRYLGLKNVPSSFVGSVKRTNTILQKEENCCYGTFLFGPIIKKIGNNIENGGGGLFAIQPSLRGGILHGRATMAGIDDLLGSSSNNNNDNHMYGAFGSACVDVTYRVMIGGSKSSEEATSEPFMLDSTTTSTTTGSGSDGVNNVIGGALNENRPSVTIRNQASWGTQLQPRADGNYFGFASRIRDYKEESKFDMAGSKYWDYKNIPPVSSYVRGTIQFNVPTSSLIRKSSLLCFADWSTSKSCRRLTSTVSNSSSNNNNDMGGETINNYHKKTAAAAAAAAPANILQRGSIGCGFNLVPFKFRLSYTQNGEFGMSFGLTAEY